VGVLFLLQYLVKFLHVHHHTPPPYTTTHQRRCCRCTRTTVNHRTLPHTIVHHRTAHHRAPRYTTVHLHRTPPYTTVHHRTPPHTTAHHRTPPHTTAHHRTPPCARLHPMFFWDEGSVNTPRMECTKETSSSDSSGYMLCGGVGWCMVCKIMTALFRSPQKSLLTENTCCVIFCCTSEP
jgi:hypothetical protein